MHLLTNTLKVEIDMMKTIFSAARLKKIIETERMVKILLENTVEYESRLTNCASRNEIEILHEKIKKMVYRNEYEDFKKDLL